MQSVVNSNGLRIHSETTIATSVYAKPGQNIRDIYIGNFHEMHYMSTTPIAQSVTQPMNHQPPTTTSSKQTKGNSPLLQSQQTLPEKSDSLQTRKDYMTEYMKKRWMNNKFKDRENERK